MKRRGSLGDSSFLLGRFIAFVFTASSSTRIHPLVVEMSSFHLRIHNPFPQTLSTSLMPIYTPSTVPNPLSPSTSSLFILPLHHPILHPHHGHSYQPVSSKHKHGTISYLHIIEACQVSYSIVGHIPSPSLHCCSATYFILYSPIQSRFVVYTSTKWTIYTNPRLPRTLLRLRLKSKRRKILWTCLINYHSPHGITMKIITLSVRRCQPP